MSVEIQVPTLGESVTEATDRASWLKKAGDAVSADEPLVELETDKVTPRGPRPGGGRAWRRSWSRSAATSRVGDRDRPDRGGRRRRRQLPRAKAAGPARRSRPWPRAAARRRPETAARQRRALAEPPRATGAAQAGPAARKIAAEKGIDLAPVPAPAPRATSPRATCWRPRRSRPSRRPRHGSHRAGRAEPSPAARPAGREERVRMTRLGSGSPSA